MSATEIFKIIGMSIAIGAIVGLAVYLFTIGVQNFTEWSGWFNRRKVKELAKPTTDEYIFKMLPSHMLLMPPVKRVRDAREVLTEIEKWAQNGNIQQEAARWGILADHAVSMSTVKGIEEEILKWKKETDSIHPPRQEVKRPIINPNEPKKQEESPRYK